MIFRHAAFSSLLAIACGGETQTLEGDASDTNDGESIPWVIDAERALPVVPAAYLVRARGSTLLLRTADGVWRSLDDGEAFAFWSGELTVDVLPLTDGGALQVRHRAGPESELVLEHLPRDATLSTTPTAIELGLDWQGATWIGGAFAPGRDRQWLQAYTRLGDTISARLLQIRQDDGAYVVDEVALPEGWPSDANWLVADLPGAVAIATTDGDGKTLLATRSDGTPWVVTPFDGLLDLVSTADEELVVSRVIDGVASLVRLEIDPGGIGSTTLSKT